MSYTWQPLGPLLKVKLLVGYMYTCSNLKSPKTANLKHHHRSSTIKYNYIYNLHRKDGKSVTFSEWIFWSMFQFTPPSAPACAPAARSFSIASVLFPPEENAFCFHHWRGIFGAKKTINQVIQNQCMKSNYTQKISVVLTFGKILACKI